MRAHRVRRGRIGHALSWIVESRSYPRDRRRPAGPRGRASGPPVGNEGELFSASELTKKKDAGTDAGGDAPALHKKHRDRIKKEKCEPRKRPLEDRCEYVRTHPACETDDNLVHYLRLHYCSFGPTHQTRSHLTQAILVVLLCSVLANVAEHFFCPALSNVAGWLALPEDVAGATLLSFGNGAPDVFTQIAALHNASAQGISLGIGAALGASFFVASRGVSHRRTRGAREDGRGEVGIRRRGRLRL